MVRRAELDIVITGDETDLRQATARSNAHLASVGRSTREVGRTVTRSLGKRSGSSMAIRNASFQFGDLAVQMAAGTSASRALAMQLPQLLGGFGTLGAVLGAVAAIGIPVATAMRNISSEGGEITKVFGTLQPAAQAVGAAFSRLGELSIAMAEAVVNNLDRILIIGGTVATLFAGKFVAGFVAARLATFSFAGALTFLRGAIIRTGIGALVVGAGELIYQFTRLAKAAGGFGEAVSLVADVAREAMSRVASAFKAGAYRAAEQMYNLQADSEIALAGLIRWVADTFANKIIGTFVGVYKASVAAWEQLPAAFKRIGAMAINGLVSIVELGARSLIAPLNAVLSAVNVPTIKPDFSAAKVEVPGEAGALGAAASEAFTRAFNADYAGGLIGNLLGSAGEAQQQAGQFGNLADIFTADATKPLTGVKAIKDVLASIKEENIDLPSLLGGSAAGGDDEGGGSSGGDTRQNDQFVKALQTKREQLQAWYEEQKQILASMNEEELAALGGHNEAKLRLEREYQRKLAEIRQAEARARVSMIQNWTSTISSILSSFGSMMEVENKKQFERQKKIRTASAVIEGIGAAIAAWRSGMEAGGLPLAAAYTLASVAKTAAQISAIQRQTYNGASGGSANAGGTPTVPQPDQPQRPAVELTLIGDQGFSRKQITQIMEAINDAGDDGTKTVNIRGQR